MHPAGTSNRENSSCSCERYHVQRLVRWKRAMDVLLRKARQAP
nr:MAG TPA: hypothetical protein [Caudoviricetes sp.]